VFLTLCVFAGGGCLIATERHLPPNIGEYTPPQSQPDRLVLSIPTPEGWPGWADLEG